MKIIKNDEAVSPVKTVTTEDAVSPVIGVILMVAITVILAAVIAAFVFGLAGTTQTTRTVGTTVTLNSSNTQWFNLQFTGGSDLPAVSAIKVSRDGAPVTIGALGTGVFSPGFQSNITVSDNSIKPAPNDKFQVGQILLIDAGATVSGHKITILGTFTDGGTQILYDRTL